jgi:hypothetical protein
MTEQMLDFFRAHKKFKDQFVKLTLMSTHAEYDPSNPANKVRNLQLDTMYNTLPEAGQKLYRDYRDYYKDMNAIQEAHISRAAGKTESSWKRKRVGL